MKPSRSDFIMVRGLRYHIRRWGVDATRSAASTAVPTAVPKIVMLHGWMDVSASFQFVVDNLARDWEVIAPDWRGYGLTERSGADCYWFPDYLGDLDAILDHYAPNEPVNLLGHSMGGNVSSIYAGVRPERVAKLINLEGFGLPATKPEQAPARYAKWLDELREPTGMRPYATQDEVAARLQKTNSRLSRERAAFLARHWAAQNERGEWEILGDPAHKLTNPVLYRVDEVLACWRAITAPVLWVEARDTEAWGWMGAKEVARAEIDRRIACIANVRTVTVDNAAHMLHHDQPEAVARLIEDFLIS